MYKPPSLLLSKGIIFYCDLTTSNPVLVILQMNFHRPKSSVLIYHLFSPHGFPRMSSLR